MKNVESCNIKNKSMLIQNIEETEKTEIEKHIT